MQAKQIYFVAGSRKFLGEFQFWTKSAFAMEIVRLFKTLLNVHLTVPVTSLEISIYNVEF